MTAIVRHPSTDDDTAKTQYTQKLIDYNQKNLPTLLFEYNEAALSKIQCPLLDAVLQPLEALPQLSVQAQTDDVGTETRNQALSEARAEAVRTLLLDAGLSPERIKTQAFGATRPLVPNDTEANRARNRRVNFSFE
ncbi:OmpA family protein [Eisenibacter elegans]|uniref:OmpA family protein n=1 Tax=Eisenibacter elegans TaxID=997 RepID=UPI000427C2B5|nr:OmpA family protein [Eisenibacter elegans]